jgi:hypothetical protein
MFEGQRILVCAKEAGAGAYFGALLKKIKAKDLLVLAYPKASQVFAESGIEHKVINSETKRYGRSIIATFNPEVVCVSFSIGTTLEKILLQEAKKRHIPVFVFLDSYVNLWQRFTDKTGLKKWYYLPDKIFVINEFSKKRIIAQGAPAKAINVLEHPLLQASKKKNLENEPLISRSGVCRKLKIPTNSKIILLVSENRFRDSKIWQWDQPAPKDLICILRVIVKVAKILGEDCGVPCYVVIKRHPAERGELIKALTSKQRKFCRSVTLFDKLSLIDAADIVTGLSSILLSEAAKRNKIVFSYHEGISNEDVWFSAFDDKIIEIKSKEMSTQFLLKKLLKI